MDSQVRQPVTERCPARKQGEFHRLGCIMQRGHDGACNFVTMGVRETSRAQPTIRELKAKPVTIDKDGRHVE